MQRLTTPTKTNLSMKYFCTALGKLLWNSAIVCVLAMIPRCNRKLSGGSGLGHRGVPVSVCLSRLCRSSCSFSVSTCLIGGRVWYLLNSSGTGDCRPFCWAICLHSLTLGFGCSQWNKNTTNIIIAYFVGYEIVQQIT